MIAPDGRVVVVGGGLAAARVCSALRRKGLTGPLEVLSAENHLPYDRPPLSKGVLAGKTDGAPLPFDTEKLAISYRQGCTATGLDIEARVVRTDQGGVPYDGLVVATGGTPIRLPGDGDQITLRTVDDALRLRSRLTPGSHVVIIGASWIGAEVATAAYGLGCHVTCLELGATPLAHTLGDKVAAHLLPWWEDIDLRCSTAVREVSSDGVVLADGSRIEADVVVTGIGIRPELRWLEGSGLELDHGVLTDDRCRANVPGIVALGDAAQRWSPRTGRYVLVEHWDNAGSAAITAASALIQDDVPAFDPVPYFWSDQFGRKVQYVGYHDSEDEMEIRLDDNGDLDVVTWTAPDGTLSAWLGVDRPKDVVKARMSVGQLSTDPAST